MTRRASSSSLSLSLCTHSALDDSTGCRNKLCSDKTVSNCHLTSTSDKLSPWTSVSDLSVFLGVSASMGSTGTSNKIERYSISHFYRQASGFLGASQDDIGVDGSSVGSVFSNVGQDGTGTGAVTADVVIAATPDKSRAIDGKDNINVFFDRESVFGIGNSVLSDLRGKTNIVQKDVDRLAREQVIALFAGRYTDESSIAWAVAAG